MDDFGARVGALLDRHRPIREEELARRRQIEEDDQAEHDTLVLRHQKTRSVLLEIVRPRLDCTLRELVSRGHRARIEDASLEPEGALSLVVGGPVEATCAFGLRPASLEISIERRVGSWRHEQTLDATEIDPDEVEREILGFLGALPPGVIAG